MMKKPNTQNANINVDGDLFSLDESQTGKFGITLREFENMIITILADTSSKSRSQNALLNLLLKRMGIRTHGEPKKEYVKDYIIYLRDMKEKGLVEFVSGKTKLNIRLPK